MLSSCTSLAPLVVAGAGAGGMAAALAALSNGQEVILLDNADTCGGTVKQALIHTLGGFYDSEGNVVNGGLAVELLDRLQAASPYSVKRRMGRVWVLNVDPAIYVQVLQAWLQEFPKLQFLTGSTIAALELSADKATEPNIDTVLIRTPTDEYSQPIRALVDATSQAAIVRQWNPQAVEQGLALAGFIVQLRGVDTNVMRFPHSMTLLHRIRKATADGELPTECATVWLDTGVFPHEAYAKFNLPVSAWNTEHLHQVAQILLRFLQQHTHGFGDAYISHYSELGLRDGGQMRGRYCLTEIDLKQATPFADTACYGCWPIEHWRLDKGIELEYFPAGHRYAIPLRALQVEGINNLWVAGKCLSAQPRAQASTRVVGTCWAMGEAVGNHLTKGA